MQPAPAYFLNGRQRIDESPASEALREALINTLIHADYLQAGVVKIEKYPDKFVFSNPGNMRRPLEYAREGGISEWTTPKISAYSIEISLKSTG